MPAAVHMTPKKKTLARAKRTSPSSSAVITHPQQHQHHRKLGLIEKKAFHKLPWVQFLDHLVTFASVAAPILSLPQLFDIIEHQSGAGVSLITWGGSAIVKAVWTLYGVTHREWPIIISNVLLLIVNAMIVGAVLYYA